MRMPAARRPRRLTRTAVEDATRTTDTRAAVSRVHDTEKLPDGRHRVAVDLDEMHAFARDPREHTPEVRILIRSLEGTGWTVQGKPPTRLIVSEPVTEEGGQ